MRPALILLVALLLPLPSSAQETPPAEASPAELAGGAEQEFREWRETLLEARERVASAHQRVAEAQYAYRDARQRRRRGGERADLLTELQGAEQELAEAEAALPVLLEQARRAGVPPGVLREFED